MRRIIVLLAICLWGNIIFAQEEKEIRLPRVFNQTFGFKGGLNYSKLDALSVDRVEWRPGINAGVFYCWDIMEYVSFQPELNLSARGGYVRLETETSTAAADFNMHYLDLPVLGGFNLTYDLKFVAGPYVSYLINVNIKDDDPTFDNRLSKEAGIRNFKRWDYGLTGGLQYDLYLLKIGLRYEHGFNKLVKNASFYNQTRIFREAYHQGFHFYLAMNL